MATIYDTTMSPSKLELLSAWMPQQEWYRGPATPQLRRAGGFRLDDPAGEVGVEFVIVHAIDGANHVTYLVPMTYRGELLTDAEPSLIGTAMHGVLGKRWIYDATGDPVFIEELTRLLLGNAVPQHQSRSDEVDTSVIVRTTADADVARAARVVRVLGDAVAGDAPGVTATWVAPDGGERSGVVVTS